MGEKQRHSKLFGWPRSINPIVVYSYKPCGIPASMMILSLNQFILGAINRNGNCFYTRRMLFFKIKTFSNWTFAEDFFLSAEARKNFIKERRSSFVASQISRKQENFYTYMKKTTNRQEPFLVSLPASERVAAAFFFQLSLLVKLTNAEI